MTLDQKLKDRINEILNSNKLDTKLCFDFMRILDNEGKDLLTLEKSVSYFATGNPQTTPKGMKKSTILPEVYTAKTTYRELLGHVENSEFKNFQKSTQYQPL